MEKNREKEGAPKLLRSNNQEGRQVKVKPSNLGTLELGKPGWSLVYDTACGRDMVMPQSHVDSGMFSKV